MKCEYCNYEWETRKEQPVSCPRCKRRFDYPKDASEDLLAPAKNVERGFQRMIYVMSRLTPELERNGLIAVVVGGSAVEFYTQDWYATGDIDLAINKDRRIALGQVLGKFGFKSMGRMWIREDLNLYIEAPGDIKDIDRGKVTRVKTDAGYVNIIGQDDIIFDRVQAAKHWDSESDKEQAIRIAAMFYDEIDWEYLKNKCTKEDSLDTLEEVKEAARNARKKV
jgi:hypothetical protein